MGEVNLYELQALRNITGSVIRPGGFQLTDRGLACCGLVPGTRVLDIGCGTGAAVDYVRRQHGLAAVGLDFSAVLLKEGSRTYGESSLVRGRAEQLPVADGRFGAVLCECMLSLCPDPLIVLREAWRALQPRGFLVVTDVYSRGADVVICTGKPSVHGCLQGAVDRPSVENRITAAGYDLLLWEDHSVLLKQLAAQLVWTYGSLDAFWSAVAGPSVVAMTGSAAGGCRRPGYYLLVARKPKTN
jgi:arsenite methyltransferase